MLHRASHPIPPEEALRALARVTRGRADLLLVHSSLSKLGRFTAGLDNLLWALQEVSETLVLPTHSYLYPREHGELAPVFDAVSSPSRNGLLTELFRMKPGVRRSRHSTHSLAVAGPLADELTHGHYLCDTPCGEGTPYSRLIGRKAGVLMLGVDFDAYTFFHTAEDAADSPFAYEPNVLDRLRVIDEFGDVREQISRRQAGAPRRFAACGEEMERRGLVRREALGSGFLFFVPDSSKAHDYLVDHLRVVPDFTRADCRTPLW